MSRSLSASNQAEIDADHFHEVVLVKLEFDTPIYVHSGIGNITYDGDVYLGVGDFGGVSETKETENLRPTSLTLTLSGIDPDHITEALDSGNFGDVVSIFIGYRQDDGTLVDDPWLAWRGTFDHASIQYGENNVVSIVVQHDLAVLADTHGSRFTDEDQQFNFTGDLGFEFQPEMANLKLLWGGGSVSGGSGGGGGTRGPVFQR